MKAKFINEFHRTEIKIEAVETAVCGPDELPTLCAYFTDAQLKKVGYELCGISGCCCGGWTGQYCEGEDGKKYYVQWTDKNPAAVALGRRGGSVKSDKKSKSSAANGALGGRPRTCLYAVQVLHPDTEEWDYCFNSPMSRDEANKSAKQLRRWAKEEDTEKRYRVIKVELS